MSQATVHLVLVGHLVLSVTVLHHLEDELSVVVCPYALGHRPEPAPGYLSHGVVLPHLVGGRGSGVEMVCGCGWCEWVWWV